MQKIRLVGWLVLLSVFLVACSDLASPAGDELAAWSGAEEDHYIVVLHERAFPARAAANRARAAEVARSQGVRPIHAYGAALVGFSAEIPAGRLNALRNDPRVAYVEPVLRVGVTAQSLPTGISRIDASSNAAIGIDGSDDVRVDVDVAVLDTGVDYDHPDLNVVGGADCTLNSIWNIIFDNVSCQDGGAKDGDDDHYHGTHVAGSIGAIDNGAGVVGVAPGARIWAVKVLDQNGSGYTSEIVAGIDWVTAHGGIDVINMSLGGAGQSQATDDAIAGAVGSGVFVAVAAGNDSDDAANYTPANSPDAFAVSALADFDGQPGGTGSPTCRNDQDDTLADFSNYGATVEMAAPGVCILSTYPLEQGGYGTISGTSMAAPHVAGAAALLASQGLGVGAIASTLLDNGNSDWTDDSGDGVKEPLLDVGSSVFAPATVAGSGGGGGTPNGPPTASFDYDCTDLTCTFDGSASSDPDNDALGYSWDFGDDATADGATASHTYSAGGTYTVTLTVDDGTDSDSESQEVIVSAPPSGGITLSASGYKVKGRHHVDLTWSGASGGTVDVFRDGSVVATTDNDGAYTDSTGNRGGRSYSYRVCEADSSTCSNAVTVTF